MKSQNGSSLIFTLIVLVAMLFGTISLFKSADTSSIIASNLAAKELSVKAADVALQDATTFLNDPSGFMSITNFNMESDVTLATAPQVPAAHKYMRYYAVQRKVSVTGTNASVVCALPVTSTANCPTDGKDIWPDEKSTDVTTYLPVGNNRVWYVVDRMCEAAAGVDPSQSCLLDQQAVTDSSKVGGSFTSTVLSTTAIYYRVTIKIASPSNTTSYVQAVLPKQI